MLPPALLCGALGLALGLVGRRELLVAAGVLIVSALIGYAISLPKAWTDGVFLTTWAVVALVAAAVHLPRAPPLRLVLVAAAVAGGVSGLLTRISGNVLDLAGALPCVLVAVPAQWMHKRGWFIVVKIAGSWLIAVAVLAAGLSMVPTPGYVPDHME